MSKEQTELTNEDIKVMFAEETGITTYSPMGEIKYIEWLENKVIALTKEEIEKNRIKAY